MIQNLSKSREKDLIFYRLKSDLAFMNEAKNLELDESLVEAVYSGEIETPEDLEIRLSESISGQLDGLRYTVLSLVVEGRYDTAIAEINYYGNSERKLQVFRNRTKRYFTHCEELIRAVESKIKFCQTRTITRSQKHELYMMVTKHFRELTDSLKKIERIENDIRIKDLKSTVWVLKAFFICLSLLLATAMVKEAIITMKEPSLVIIDDLVNQIFRLIGM